MKIKISLLVAYLLIAGLAEPSQALSTQNAPSPTPSKRVKDLENILRMSGLCKHYPSVVRILNENTVQVATYVDRKLSQPDLKILALQLGKLIESNTKNILTVKERFYDPSSIKYWKDITLSQAQIDNGLKTGAQQEEIVKSINIINNFGLVDGPNLESRIATYKHILKLQTAGIQTQPFLAEFLLIEKAEKDKKNITSQLSNLDDSLALVDTQITKPISSEISTPENVSSLQKAWEKSCQNEEATLQAVEDAEHAQRAVALPEAYDLDAHARNDNELKALQDNIDNALASWHQARQDRERASEELERAKEHY